MVYYKQEIIIDALTNLEANLLQVFGTENAYIFMVRNVKEMILSLPVEIVDINHEGVTNAKH